MNPSDGLKQKALIVAELMAVFACAYALYFYYNVFSGAPNLALIFDAQAYLSAAHGAQEILNWKFASQLIASCLQGLSESERLQFRCLVADRQGALELLHTGPVLPCLLAVVYSGAGKAATTVNWQLSSHTMMLLQASTISLIYLAALVGFGRKAARLSALFSFLTAAFAVNSGRPISEVPAAFCVAVWILSWMALVGTLPQDTPAAETGQLPERQQSANCINKKAQWAAAAIAGIASGILPMVRTNLSLLPMAALCMIPILWGRRQTVKLLSLLIPFCLCIVLTLAPWTLFQGMVSGNFSPLVDRYGSYNLYAGLNLQADGLDVLPGPYVAHPDRFKQTTAETLRQIVAGLKQHPCAYADMLLRKVSRLVNSPFNDFETACLGQSWPFQVFFHQWLLLLACLGLLVEFDGALQQRSPRRLSLILLPGLVVGYQVLNCLFIAMRRYFFPAMPAVILLSAIGFGLLFKARSRKEAVLLAVSTLSPPTTCLLLTYFSSAGMPLAAQLALVTDVPFAATLFAALMALSILVWALISCLLLRPSPVSNRIFWALALSGSLVAFLSTGHNLQAIACPLFLRQPSDCLSVSIPVTGQSQRRRWFLVVDAAPLPAASSLNSPDYLITVNGRTLSGTLRPWFSFDYASRENYLFESAFAYCSAKELTEIRQWAALEVPLPFLHFATANRITITNRKAGKPAYVMADIWSERRKYNHRLSLTAFSWTKGFFIDPRGDMRMDEWVATPDCQSGQAAPYLAPRLCLVAVDLKDGQCGDGPDAQTNTPAATQFKFAGAHIGPGLSERVVFHRVALPSIKNADEISAAFNAIQYAVNGKYRSISGQSKASVGLVEYDSRALGSSPQFAPAAPLHMVALPQWSTFEFTDTVPLVDSSVAVIEPSKSAPEAMLLLGGKSWWDILSYGQFKGKGRVLFDNLHLTVKPVTLPDFAGQKWQAFYGRLSTEPRK
jgi:4-amino-4-deoxy-L-arabinose transferase-like glycosyltransferase